MKYLCLCLIKKKERRRNIAISIIFLYLCLIFSRHLSKIVTNEKMTEKTEAAPKTWQRKNNIFIKVHEKKKNDVILTFLSKREKEKMREKHRFLITFIYCLTYSKSVVLCCWRQNSLLILYRRRSSLTNFNIIKRQKSCLYINIIKILSLIYRRAR